MSLLPPWPTPSAAVRHARVRVEPRASLPTRAPACRVPVPLPAPVETAWRVESVDVAGAERHRAAWLGLMDRALEANVFLDPDFALPAARHLATGRGPVFLLVWSAEAGDLVAVCPVVARPGPVRALASVWTHDLSTLGFPLLDRERGAAALPSLLLWAGREMPRARGIVVRALPSEGPTAAALRRVAADLGLDLVDLESWRRAVLRPGPGRAGLSALSRKGAKELGRQRRRLAERGTLAYASVREGDALREAVEAFLALEAAGWKGAAGTALLARPARTAFARSAARLLGRRGLCRVDSLELDGRPIAMALILTAGATDFLWKIAYREDVSRFSPGVQLVLDITEAQLRGGRATLTDSCAVPDHPMIDRLWCDRLCLGDVAVATRPGRSRGFRIAVAAERVARQVRSFLKRAVLARRGRRGGPAEA